MRHERRARLQYLVIKSIESRCAKVFSQTGRDEYASVLNIIYIKYVWTESVCVGV